MRKNREEMSPHAVPVTVPITAALGHLPAVVIPILCSAEATFANLSSPAGRKQSHQDNLQQLSAKKGLVYTWLGAHGTQCLSQRYAATALAWRCSSTHLTRGIRQWCELSGMRGNKNISTKKGGEGRGGGPKSGSIHPFLLPPLRIPQRWLQRSL